MKKILFLLLLASNGLFGQFTNEVYEQDCFNRLLKDSIFINKSSVKPGDTFSVLIELDLKKDWKVYWKTSGGISFPMDFIWAPPKGITFIDIKYPYPKYLYDKTSAFSGASFYNKYSIDKKTGDHIKLPTYIATFKVDSDTPAGPLDLSLVIKWQACKVRCLSPPASLIPTRTISVNVSDKSAFDSTVETMNQEALKQTPVKAPVGWKIHAFKTNSSYKEIFADKASLQASAEITLVSPDAIDPLTVQFFPNEQAFAKQANNYSFKTINTKTIRRTFEINADVKTVPNKISGVITITKDGKTTAYEIEGSVEDKEFVAAQDANFRTVDNTKVVKAKDTGILINLVFAFFGGFILNLMPCVFPVLSIKVMGFVKQAQEGKSHAVKHALVFTVGALISFWILAGTMLALKGAVGSNVDWGFQLQNVYVVYTLVLILFIMALNLFGLFEIGIGLTGAGQSVQHKSGMSGSFFSGVLATVVATPCMAPMLGPALAYAFTQPAAIAMVIFTIICLGMCSPYIILAMSPKLLKFIPKPGAWMETFKQAMGFLMLLAVIWLLNTLQKQIAYADYLFNILWAFTAVAIACWIYGKYCPMYLDKKVRIKGLIATLIIGGFGLYYGYAKINDKPALDWIPFDTAELDKYRREGKPVFLDFTASWCATCQVNKNIAMYPNAALFKEKGVITMKADNTNKTPLISKWLKEYESTGVPLNLLFDGKNPIPIKFPETYSSSTMKKALETIK